MLGNEITVNSVFTKILGKGVGFMMSFVRQYPGFAYLGLGPLGWYEFQRNISGKAAGSMAKISKVTGLEFEKIAKIEATMSEDGKKVMWYEGRQFTLDARITADSSTSAVVVNSLNAFAVGDLVRTMPAAGSAGTSTTATIVSINTGTKTITLSSAVSVVSGDRLLLVTAKHTTEAKVTRTAYDDAKGTECFSYFQKFGASVTVKQIELNRTRLLQEAQTYAQNLLVTPVAQIFENIVTTWLFGRNITGASPETEGIVTLINEREARGQTSIFDFASYTTDKEKLEALQDLLNQAASAPVYQGQEKPTVFCTTQFGSNVSKLFRNTQVFNDMTPKTIEYNLESLSTPYFRNINFVILPEFDRIFGANVSRAFVFPRELVGFRTPENQSVAENGTLIKSQNRFSVIKQPVVTNDFVEYTMEFWLANIFGGQSYNNVYMEFKNL